MDTLREGGGELFNRLKTPIKFKKHREIEGKIKSISIVRTPTGKYYLNVLVDREIKQHPPTDKVVAIDMGLTHFATLSTGEKIENPRYLERTLRRIKRLQRKLSRKVKGSKNYQKLAKRLAKLYEKVKNQWDDFLHKLSKKVIGDKTLLGSCSVAERLHNQAVIVEDLGVKELLEKGNLSRQIADASWKRFINFLEYKAKWERIAKPVRNVVYPPINSVCVFLCYKPMLFFGFFVSKQERFNLSFFNRRKYSDFSSSFYSFKLGNYPRILFRGEFNSAFCLLYRPDPNV